MAFIDDFALMGFWPMFEPSGSPLFYNYSNAPLDPANVGRSSGIDHHLHVSTTNTYNYEPRTSFPGLATINEAISGVTFDAYLCTGMYDRPPDQYTPYEKILIVGRSVPSEGLRGSQAGVSIPQVAQSGFTVGLWVYPNSNGWVDIPSLVAPRTESSIAHALLSQGLSTQGWAIGVSGFLKNDARGSEFVEGGGNRQLRAYAHYMGATDAASVLLDTPIESGRFTHITASYRFDSVNVNQWSFYKDGRLVGSGNSIIELTDTGSTSYADCRILVGGFTNALGRPEWSTGFGHAVSGVYAFRRVLDEGEILQLHNQGGLQPGEGTVSQPEATEVNIEDPNLIGYYPFLNVGYADASANRWPLVTQVDEGDTTTYHIPYTGPFNHGGALNNGFSSPSLALSTGSGTTTALCTAANNAGFTIAFWAESYTLTILSQDMLCSFGSVGSTPSITPTISNHSAGFMIAPDDESGANSLRIKVVVYENGNPSDSKILREAGTDAYNALQHIAFVYDNAENGIALYIDGEFQASGQMDAPLGPHLMELAGSGFPICFIGGVADDNIETFVTNGGKYSAISEIMMASRPLRADEIRFLSQSGIDMTQNYYTANDPRLRAYWRGRNEPTNTPVVVQDRARMWERLPLNLTRAEAAYKWEQVLAEPTTGPFIRTDLFVDRTIPPELDSDIYGNLGVTSGVYTSMGGTAGIQAITTEQDRSSSLGALSLRVAPAVQERDLEGPFFNEEWICSFDITPSGNIPASVFCDNQEFNSIVVSMSDGMDNVTREQFVGYLTTINANGPDPLGADAGTGASGVSIVFYGIDGNPATVGQAQPLISGNLVFGVPQKVLFHMKPLNPYTWEERTGGSRIQLDLYVDGNKQNSIEFGASVAKIWHDVAPGTATDDRVLEWGGYAVDDTTTGITAFDTGLGELYVREMFIAKGQFSKFDIDFLATSGIVRTSPLSIFSDQISASIVRVNDSRLVGYYRFTGGVGGSGTLDLSDNGNHLTNLADQAIQGGVAIAADSYAYNLRWIPGPLRKSRLANAIGVETGQASGITFKGNFPNLDGNCIPSLAVSGARFDTPDSGFSIGFWYVTRELVASNDLRVIASYGITPTNSVITTDIDACWAVVVDDLEQVKLIISKDGRMYADPANSASKAGSIEVGPQFSALPYRDNNTVEKVINAGVCQPPHLDSWVHYGFIYDADNESLKAYMNGILIDEKVLPGTINTPTDPTARILSFLTAQSDVWNWEAATACDYGILTDFFYFDAPITDEEMHYIAFNGIAEGDTPKASGLTGGHIYGQDTGSGIIGGWLRGFQRPSGLAGGWLTGAFEASGIVGGYVSGLLIPDLNGTIGGWVLGKGIPSGLVGGWITGSNNASGLFGGFIYSVGEASGQIIGGWIDGGLSGVIEFDGYFITSALSGVDFDAMLQVAKTTSSDFDAKVQVYEAEKPPLIDIIVPDITVSGLAPPFNQYFVAVASGQQGKTIQQAKWTFGDFTGSTIASESGTNPGHYAIQHRFAESGFYVVKFHAIDSEGQHAAAVRFVNAASGIDPVRIALSGVPQVGEAALTVAFDQNYVSIPTDVTIIQSLLDLDNGRTTTIIDPTVVYTEPGIYKPIWIVRDSRGVIWSDSLGPNIDFDIAQNESGM